jgi:hypothetical protein
MEQVNPLPRPRGPTDRFLHTFPPIDTTERDVKYWVTTWIYGRPYRTLVHPDFDIAFKSISSLQLAGRDLRDLTPEELRQRIVNAFSSPAVAEPLWEDILMARESVLERESVRERVSTIDIVFR